VINRLFVVLGLMAMLVVGAPSLMADHGNKGKHDDQDSQGWERRDGYEYHVYGHDERPPDGAMGKRPVGETAECLLGKPRSTVAGVMFTKDVAITITTMMTDGLLCVVQSSRLKAA